MIPFMSFVFGNEAVRSLADDKLASPAFGDQRSLSMRKPGAPHLGTTSRAARDNAIDRGSRSERGRRGALAATGRPARFGQTRPRGSAAPLRSRLPWPHDCAPTPRRRTPRTWRRRAGPRRRKRDERGRSAQRRLPSELPPNRTRLRIPTVSTSSAPKLA